MSINNNQKITSIHNERNLYIYKPHHIETKILGPHFGIQSPSTQQIILYYLRFQGKHVKVYQKSCLNQVFETP